MQISRRDFLKLFLAAVGAFLFFVLGKLEELPVPAPSLTPTPMNFSAWGQDNLTFEILNTPYQLLS